MFSTQPNDDVHGDKQFAPHNSGNSQTIASAPNGGLIKSANDAAPNSPDNATNAHPWAAGNASIFDYLYWYGDVIPTESESFLRPRLEAADPHDDGFIQISGPGMVEGYTNSFYPEIVWREFDFLPGTPGTTMSPRMIATGPVHDRTNDTTRKPHGEGRSLRYCGLQFRATTSYTPKEVKN